MEHVLTPVVRACPAAGPASHLKGIANIKVQPAWTVQMDGDRHDCLNTIRAIRQRRCDVTVRFSGLSARDISRPVRAVFDFALDAGVPIQFEYRGEFLQLEKARPGRRGR